MKGVLVDYGWEYILLLLLWIYFIVQVILLSSTVWISRFSFLLGSPYTYIYRPFVAQRSFVKAMCSMYLRLCFHSILFDFDDRVERFRFGACTAVFENAFEVCRSGPPSFQRKFSAGAKSGLFRDGLDQYISNLSLPYLFQILFSTAHMIDRR